MKRSIFWVLLSFLALSTYAQDPDLYFRDQQLKRQEENKNNSPSDSIVHRSGYVFRKGDNVKMGIGTLMNGDFKFVRVSSQSLLWSQNDSQNALPARYAGLNGEIASISQRGSKKRGFTYYLIMKFGLPGRYEIDIESALAAGEILLPDQYMPNKKSSNSTLSTADELLKLKKLLDDGILTKEEFEAEKKKLLQKQ